MGQVAEQVDSALYLDAQRPPPPPELRQNLPSRLNAPLSPPLLLHLEGQDIRWKFSRHTDIAQVLESPPLHLSAVAQVEVLGERVGLPAPCVEEALPPPNSRGAVEVEEAPRCVASTLLEVEVTVEQERLSPSEAVLLLIQVIPPSLDHTHRWVHERTEQPVQ